VVLFLFFKCQLDQLGQCFQKIAGHILGHTFGSPLWQSAPLLAFRIGVLRPEKQGLGKEEPRKH
jgi:hypothetical protein